MNKSLWADVDLTLSCSNRRYGFLPRELSMIRRAAQTGFLGPYRLAQKTKLRREHEHDYHQRRHHDLLQGLGHRTADHVFAWLAFDCGCVGRTDAFLWPTGLSRHRA